MPPGAVDEVRWALYALQGSLGDLVLELLALARQGSPVEQAAALRGLLDLLAELAGDRLEDRMGRVDDDEMLTTSVVGHGEAARVVWELLHGHGARREHDVQEIPPELAQRVLDVVDLNADADHTAGGARIWLVLETDRAAAAWVTQRAEARGVDVGEITAGLHWQLAVMGRAWGRRRPR